MSEISLLDLNVLFFLSIRNKFLVFLYLHKICWAPTIYEFAFEVIILIRTFSGRKLVELMISRPTYKKACSKTMLLHGQCTQFLKFFRYFSVKLHIFHWQNECSRGTVYQKASQSNQSVGPYDCIRQIIISVVFFITKREQLVVSCKDIVQVLKQTRILYYSCYVSVNTPLAYLANECCKTLSRYSPDNLFNANWCRTFGSLK